MEDRGLEDTSQIGEKEYNRLSFPRVIIFFWIWILRI